MMSTQNSPEKIKRFKTLIIAASIAIPLVVALLFRVKIDGVDLGFLPSIYATINGITALVLVAALVAIKSKNQLLHNRLINFALVLSLLFLVCYVAYHMTSNSTVYGDVDGNGILEASEQTLIASSQTIYYILLVSHVILSMAVVPLVLFTYLFAYQGDFTKHKKWTRITWPLWFYVAISGVIVYWMISSYYIH